LNSPASSHSAASASRACCGSLNDALGLCAGFWHADTGQQIFHCFRWHSVFGAEQIVNGADDWITNQPGKCRRTSASNSTRDCANTPKRQTSRCAKCRTSSRQRKAARHRTHYT
jgi:hypothetical protein